MPTGMILLSEHACGNSHLLVAFPEAVIKWPDESYLAEAGFVRAHGLKVQRSEEIRNSKPLAAPHPQSRREL